MKCTPSKPNILLTKTTAAQNGVALSYRKVRGLIVISLHDSYYLENNGPKSCHLSVKFACRIDKYRVDERITMMIGVVLTYPVSSDRSKAIVAKAESSLLTSELNGHKKSFSGYTKKIKSLLANLKTSTNDTEFESISRLNSIKANSIMLSAIRTHGKKFQKLLDDSSLHFDSPYDKFLQYIERTPRQISPSIAGPLRDTKPHSKKKVTVVNILPTMNLNSSFHHQK